MPEHLNNGLRPLTQYRSCWLAGVVFLLLTVPGFAQDKLFFFSHKKPFDASVSYNDINIRPNHTTNQYLFVAAPKEMNNARVELRSPDGKVLAKSANMKFDAKGQIKQVEFIKPEAKKPADEKQPTPADPAAKVPPPAPPGKPIVPVKLNGNENYSYVFDLYLIEERKVGDKMETTEFKEQIPITVNTPDTYLTAAAEATREGIRIVVKSKSATDTSAFRDGTPSIVSLTIPPQDSLQADALGAGTYRRSIKNNEESATLEAKDLPIIDQKQSAATVRFYVDVDGYQRAFIFEPTLSNLKERSADSNRLQAYEKTDIRFYPGNGVRQLKANDKFQVRPVAKAEERYPVRLEFDNANNNKGARFIFDRGGNGTSSATNSPDEVENLISPRDIKVWLEPTGDEGQLIITSSVSDWVIQLDTYQMRGTHKMTGMVETRNNQPSESSATIVLDDTVPHLVKIIDLPDTQIKGQPMKLTASVLDKETNIKKVVFFVGPPPGPDGKRPAEPVKVEGFKTKEGSDIWTAELTLPPEAKGIMQVGLVATNDVGLEVTETKNIKLVDAPPPAGNLHVKVLRGSRPQIGISVKLKDGEGKEKAVGVSNDKGVVEFNKLPPGVYTVSAAKPDSGAGSKAEVAGKVEVEKTTEVTLSLRRGNP